MKNFTCFISLAWLAIFYSVEVHAVTPRILIHNSAVYAEENQVKAYRVPTIDQTGVTRFWDVTVVLGIDPVTGRPTALADVFSVASPSIATGVIAPGTYRSPDGLTLCSVTNVTLTSGRIQSFLNCTYNTTTTSNVSVATGSVSAGQPFLAELLTATVNTRADVNTFTWGLTTNGSFRIGSCGNFGQGWPIGAKTDGNQLVLTVFGSAAPGAFRCSGTLIKQ